MKHLGLGVAIGLVGSAVLAVQPANALTEAQIIEKLQGIPVIALTDKLGTPLATQLDDKQKTSFTVVYLGQKEADATLQKLKTTNPTVYKQLHRTVIPLSAVYKMANLDKKLNILVVPSEMQVKLAVSLLKKNDLAKSKPFDGVPLFVGVGGKPKDYLYINSPQEKKRFLPIFFDKEKLQLELDKFKKNQPGLASTAEIQVTSLDYLLSQMRTKNGSIYTQITLIRSREMDGYIPRSDGQAKPANGAKPVTTKPTTNPNNTKK